MANLITYADFAKYRDVSSNINATTRIDPYIKEAELLDIKPFLGDIFYQLVSASPSSYTLLLTGGTYVYESYTYSFEGLKAAHVYLAYARMINNDDVKSTPSGFKRKITNESEFLSEATISRLTSNAREIASAYLNDVYDFICRQDSTIYDEFSGKKKKSKSMKISAL